MRDIDALSVSPEVVLSFLQDGLRMQLRPATLRRQVAALDSVLALRDGRSLSRHPHVVRFLKGATVLAPPTVHRFPSWKLHPVLNALTKAPFEPASEVSLKYLRMKTIFLVAITSARRVSELSALSCHPSLCTFHKDKVVLRPDPAFVPKVASAFHRSQDLSLPSFCPRPVHALEKKWHSLDVRRILKIFLTRTASLRCTEMIFINISPPKLGQRMSKASIAATIRACIREAYLSSGLEVPSGISAHSTRSAATNAAYSNRASAEEICRAATWSSLSTFVKHYRLNVYASAEAAFGRRVLQHVMTGDGDAPPGI